jgi:hypothetical protein
VILILLIIILTIYLVYLSSDYINTNNLKEKFGSIGFDLFLNKPDTEIAQSTQPVPEISAIPSVSAPSAAVPSAPSASVPVSPFLPQHEIIKASILDKIKAYDNTDNQSSDISSDISSANSSALTCEPVKCTVATCGADNLFPILDPKFNMRESAKQCLLLEDHLNNKKKRCFDCIRKHFLIIDGLLEEAISLEKDIKERDKYRDLFLEWVRLEKQYAQDTKNTDNLDDLAKKIRIFRKPLVEEYFDTVSEYNV